MVNHISNTWDNTSFMRTWCYFGMKPEWPLLYDQPMLMSDVIYKKQETRHATIKSRNHQSHHRGFVHTQITLNFSHDSISEFGVFDVHQNNTCMSLLK